jgi:ankyrin repeat protein
MSDSIERAVGAAREGETDALRAWLDAGGDPNRHDAEGWTPLLAAAVRGHHEAVALLLDRGADPDLRHRESAALAIHFAGHAGSIAIADRILVLRPAHLDAVWEINGHTLLLQAAFYGYLDLARWALDRGANPAATTLRGLTASDLARQYGNQPMMELLRPYEPDPEAKAAYFKALLASVAPTTPPDELTPQELSDRLVAVIEDGLKRAPQEPGAVEATIAAVRDLLAQGADVNRLGGPLRQPPLVVAVTGNNGTPASEAMARLRAGVCDVLLEAGADPTRRERHPMGVHAVIRAAVFNHLDILKAMGRHMSRETLSAALNEIPIVNGLTALHDTVLRGSMTTPDRLDGYLDQIRWAVASGAMIDIKDFSGRTQRGIAQATADAERRAQLLEALGAS